MRNGRIQEEVWEIQDDEEKTQDEWKIQDEEQEIQDEEGKRSGR